MSPVCSVTYVSGWTPLPNLPPDTGCAGRARARSGPTRSLRVVPRSLRIVQCYPDRLLGAAGGLPRGQVGLDLPGVDLQMLGVDGEPVQRGVATRRGVTPFSRPGLLGQAPENRRGIGAHRPHGGQGGVDRMPVVVERDRPDVLVVAQD